MYHETIHFMKQMVDQQVTPGISYLLFKNKTILKGQIGVRELTPVVIPLTDKTVYDVASLTKVILTNSVILKLMEGNILDVDSKLATYLPSWHETSVTIRQLLTHTSGINPFIKNRQELNQEALIQAILQLPVEEDKQGRSKSYTDTGTILLGLLLEEYYQQDVQTIFKQQVLQPLSMSCSGFDLTEIIDVAPTEYTKERGIIKGIVHDPKAFVLKEHCGSAGLFTNIDDTWLFAQMMLNKGVTVQGKEFLKATTINSLLKDWTQEAKLSRSLGWDLLYHLDDGHPLLYHTGYTGTFMILDIINQEVFIFLSNRVHPYDDNIQYLKERDELVKIYLKEQTKD